MACQNENKFLRFSDTPTIDNVGFSKVASSLDQLENMSQEDKERVVASVALLDSYNKSLENKLSSLVNDSLAENGNLEDMVKEAVESLTQNEDELSLDIPRLDLIANLAGCELRWIKPSYKKPYRINIYKNDTNSTETGNIELVANIAGNNKDFFLINEDLTQVSSENIPFYFAQAQDGNAKGKPSNVVTYEGQNWAEILMSILRGKINETALSRDLIDNLYTGFSGKLDAEIQAKIDEAKEIIEQTETQINNVITNLRDSLNTEILSVKDQLIDQGTAITTQERVTKDHAERIDRISAVAENAVAGLQEEKVARATAQEAYARETDTKIAQVEGSIATVREEIEAKATEFESLTQEVRDVKNTFDQNEVRTTQRFTQLANQDEALAEQIRQTDAKTQTSSAKIAELEETIANQDTATAKRFNSLRSSINGSHFPNYNFEGELEGWTSATGYELNSGSSLTFKVLTDNSAPQKEAIEATGNMPVVIYSDSPTKIEISKSYAFDAILKCPDGLTKAQLLMLCFDKDKQVISNGLIPTRSPLIMEKSNQGDGWVKLSGTITGHTTEFPSRENNKIPMNAVYATPCLVLTSRVGAKFWVTKLDMQDVTAEESNKSLINNLEQTQNRANEATARKLTELESTLADNERNIAGTANTVNLLNTKVENLDGNIKATAEEVKKLDSEVGANKSSVQSLTQAVNDEKSSNASKFETLTSSFKRDLANVIINPTFTEERVTSTLNEQGQAVITSRETVQSTHGWTISPLNKMKVITHAQNPIANFKQQFPENNYLKFWGNSLTASNQLQVTPGDRIYLGLGVYHRPSTPKLRVYIRWLDRDSQRVSEHLVKELGDNQIVRLQETITVPENISKAELVLFTGSDTLAENTGYSIISKPEFRMNVGANYTDAQIESAKLAISNDTQAIAQSVETLRTTLNEAEALNQQERHARAERDNAVSGLIDTLKAKVEGAESEINTIKDVQTNDKASVGTQLNSLKTEFKKDVEGVETRSTAKFNEIQTALTTETQARANFERDLTSNFQNSTAGNSIRNFTIAEADRASVSASTRLVAQVRAASGANIIKNPEFKTFSNLNSAPTHFRVYNNNGQAVTTIIPNIGMNNSNVYRISWTAPFLGSKGFSIEQNSYPEIIFEPDREYIIAVCARVPQGITPSGTISLHLSNNPQWIWSWVEPSKPLTNNWQWYVIKAKKPLGSTGKLNELYFTIANPTNATTAVEYCLPYASAGEFWTGYKTPDYSSDIVSTKATIDNINELAVSNRGEIRAKVGVVVNANGKAVGWTAGTGTAGSTTFDIMADKFQISNGSVTKPPFSIVNNEIVFNGKVSFNSLSDKPSFPTTQQVTNIAIAEANKKDTAINNLQTKANEDRQFAEDMALVNAISPLHKQLSPDPIFKSGVGNVYVYDNNSTGRVKVERLTKSPDNPTTSTHELRITVSSGATPSYGGFYTPIQSKANAVFVIKYIIKAPTGTILNTASNPMGDNYTDRFVGSNLGTGKFHTYYRLIKCGTTGSFLYGGHVHFSGLNLIGTQTNDNIRVAMIEIYEITDLQANSLTHLVQTTEIDGGMIRTGYIDATRIDAKVINVGRNLIKNPILADLNGLKGWYIQNFAQQNYYTKGTNNSAGWYPTDSIMFNNERSLNFDNVVESGKPCQIFTDCEVKPNTTYLLSYWHQNHGQAHKLRLDCSERGVGQFNRNAETSLTLITNPGYFDKNLSNNKRVVYKIVTGPNTRFLRPIWYFDIVGQRAHFAFARPMLEEVHPLNDTPSSFTNSGVLIDESGISAPNLSAISADLGSITAGSISIGNGRFRVNTDGSVEIRSGLSNGSSKVGLHITHERIDVYDQSGNLKVRLGKLSNN